MPWIATLLTELPCRVVYAFRFVDLAEQLSALHSVLQTDRTPDLDLALVALHGWDSQHSERQPDLTSEDATGRMALLLTTSWHDPLAG